MTRWRSATAALLLVAACGSDGEGGTTSTAPRTETTRSGVTTTTADPTPPTTREPCPRIFAGAGNADQVDVAADVDGDGQDDALHSFRQEAEGDEAAYILQVELAAGGGADEAIVGDGFATVGVLGGHDLDGDGAEEIWVRVGAGASTTILGLFWLDGCDLERVTLDGMPVEVPAGASVGTLSGVECAAPGLVLHSGENVGGDAYAVHSTGYAFDAGVLVEETGADSTTTAGGAGFEVASTFTCGELSL